MKKFYFFVFTVFFSCAEQPNLESETPRIKMLSTFEVALDSKTQEQLESEFDSGLDPKNLDIWMKHMSSKPHHVGSPWSKQNAEYAANHLQNTTWKDLRETDTNYNYEGKTPSRNKIKTIPKFNLDPITLEEIKNT